MQWIIELYNKFIDFIYSLFISLIEVVKEAVWWLFGLIMDIVDSLLESVVSFFEPFDVGHYLTGLPPEISYVLGQLHVPQALAMIASALLIRLTLQLIPFVRLGS